MLRFSCAYLQAWGGCLKIEYVECLMRQSRNYLTCLLMPIAIGFLLALISVSGGSTADAQRAVTDERVPYPDNGLFYLSQSAGSPGWLYTGTNECSGQWWNYLVSGGQMAESNSTIPGLYPTGIRLDEYCASGENVPPFTGAGTYNENWDPSNHFDTYSWWDVYAWWDDDWRNFCQFGINAACQNHAPGSNQSIGGRTMSFKASLAHCTLTGTSYPCGNRGVMQLNKNRNYGNAAQTDAQWPKTVLHEYMHPFGFFDCLGPSSSAACGGNSTQMSSGYDHGALEDIYLGVPIPCNTVYLNDLADGSGTWSVYGPGNHIVPNAYNQTASAAWVSQNCFVTLWDLSFSGWSYPIAHVNPGFGYFNLTNAQAWYNGSYHAVNNDTSSLTVN